MNDQTKRVPTAGEYGNIADRCRHAVADLGDRATIEVVGKLSGVCTLKSFAAERSLLA